MDPAIGSTPLFRLKLLIWIHSAVGAALLVGLPAAAIATERKELAIGVLPALVVWCFGYRPLRKKAAELGPEDRIPAKGLPAVMTLLLAMGALLSPFWLSPPWGGWVVGAWALFGVTIVLRWVISRRLAIPVDSNTWGAILLPLSVWALILGSLLVFILMVGME